MARAVQRFDHTTPSAPARTLGMRLGASGVSAPSVQTIGLTTATSASDGSFSDSQGYGQVDYDGAGYLYVADTGNNRVQRFVKTNGVWTYDSKLTSVVTLLGGGSSPALLAIDRAANEIHLGAYDHYTASNWISVWSLSSWPSLTTLNRIRQYGANASTDTADRALQGISLTIDSTYAVVSSNGSPYRQLRWNHLTGALQNQATGTVKGRWTTDGAGTWWVARGFGAANVGVYREDPATFTGGVQLNITNTGAVWRRNRFAGGAVLSPVYHGGTVYCRGYLGDLMGWVASTDAYRDEYAQPGPVGAVPVGTSGPQNVASAHVAKSGIVVDADGCGWLVSWSYNGDSGSAQSFLTAQPLSAATATWTKTDWSAGTNTLQGIALDGVNLSAEKLKIRLRKNAGAWVTLVAGQFTGAAFSAAIAGLGTFTAGDTLTVELSLSTWERLDGHASLSAVRDKLSPTNVSLELGYNDSVADVYVPYPSAGFRGRIQTGGAYKGRSEY